MVSVDRQGMPERERVDSDKRSAMSGERLLAAAAAISRCVATLQRNAGDAISSVCAASGVRDRGRVSQRCQASAKNRRNLSGNARASAGSAIRALRRFSLPHRLMDFNNLPETRFEDVKQVLRVASERVAARLEKSKQ
jgi:hypothetical protein